MESLFRVRYTYFDHQGDVGIVGYGSTPASALVSAAEAMFALISDLAQVRPIQMIHVSFDEPDLELTLLVWLNRLFAESHAERLAFGQFSLEQTGSRWEGSAAGEPWRPDLERGVEVKGATLTMLSVRPVGDQWEARCVVDV